MPVAAVIPAGSTARPRPLLVFLHGYGANQNSYLTDAMFAALARLGAQAPDVVFPYGGPDSYWHDRADGAWGSYVMREVIPRAIARLHADPLRVAIGGISMGGFGALDLARLHPGRFCAAGGHSPALWVSGGESAAGAFDDAADFARHDVIARGPYRSARRRRSRLDRRRHPGPVPLGRHAPRESAARTRPAGDVPPLAGRPRRRLLEQPLAGLPRLLRDGARALPRELTPHRRGGAATVKR